MTESQITCDVLMIRPVRFCGNEQTAESNRFQNLAVATSEAQGCAQAEFDALVAMLKDAGVCVHSFDDTPEPHTPDSIFPNNWVSFHGDGTAVLYPMLAPNRRLERRTDILESLSTRSRFHIKRTVDLGHRESEAKYLEGTGSLVLDRVNRIAYACLSPRTHLDVLGEFSQLLDYEVVAFEATDRSGTPIYHTNVLLSIGSNYVVVCAEAIAAAQRHAVLTSLRATRTVIEIDARQMTEFAANILELGTQREGSIVAMSKRAAAAFTTDQRAQLRHLAGTLICAPIPTIETLGGGSVRCMIAELHLSRHTDS